MKLMKLLIHQLFNIMNIYIKNYYKVTKFLKLYDNLI